MIKFSAGLCIMVLLFWADVKAQSYIMSAEDFYKTEAGTITFSIYVSAEGENIQLSAYQVSLTIDSLPNSSNIHFNYVPGSSELRNAPSFGIGVYPGTNPRLAFASGAGETDTITAFKKKAGTFTLSLPDINAFNANNIHWNFDGNVSTILSSSDGSIITKEANHKIIYKNNHAPVFQLKNKVYEIIQGDTASFIMPALDEDNDNLVYKLNSFTPEPAGIYNLDSISAGFKFFAAKGDTGIYKLVAGVSDGDAEVASDTVIIIVKPRNICPVLVSVMPDTVILCTDSLTYRFMGSDENNDSIYYNIISFLPAPAGKYNIDSSSGQFCFYPSAGDTDSTFNLVLGISDGKSGHVSGNMKISVVKKNSAPQFLTIIPDTSILALETLQYKFTATDHDNDSVCYGIRLAGEAPSGMFDIDSLTGEFSFTAETADSGKTYTFGILASDGKDTVVSANFSVSVIYNIVSSVKENIPSEFNLYQNYPNPFNPSTKIKYSLTTANKTSIKIYDMLGNYMLTLFEEEQGAGEYEVAFNAAGLSSGAYIYVLTSGQFKQVKKLLLLK